MFPTDSESQSLLVGAESITWRIASDARLYPVMLYPLLLQVAHPTVGAAVRDFSDFERRPWDRLMRTLDYLTVLVYGGEEAVAAGRRLRALHKDFRGTRPDGRRYSALEPEAYAWVHATLLESYVAGHAHFGRRMTRDEVERFYDEYRQLGRLIGVRDSELPSDWIGFRRYFDHTARTALASTEAVRRVLRSVEQAPRPPAAIPELVWRAARLPAARVLWLGLGLMDPELRERLSVRWTRIDEIAFRSLGGFSRRLEPVMPQGLKVMGPAQLRWRRRAIADGPLGSDARGKAA